MDEKWFKTQQKKVGVTADEIADELGRDRSLVSRLYVGRQKMTLDQAQAFARVLKMPLNEILKHAGIMPAPETRYENNPSKAGGFFEGDAEPFHASPAATAAMNKVAQHFGQRPGVDVWTVTGNSMLLGGYLPGDSILVDTHQSERCREGDIVIAQIYQRQSGEAKTVLRRFEPPVLVADSFNLEDRRVHVVDGNNVVIRGKVAAQWRNLSSS